MFCVHSADIRNPFLADVNVDDVTGMERSGRRQTTAGARLWVIAGVPASTGLKIGEIRGTFRPTGSSSPGPHVGSSRQDCSAGWCGPLPLQSYSGLVLRSPMTRSPSFHCPRFLSTATRSKRFMTLRFAAEADADRKLGCCDIIFSFDTVFAYRPGSTGTERGF
jgi:hypothetical protein